jgi:hypothetical protein
MGTRFLASEEPAISPEWKRMIVAADAAGSVKAELLDVLLPPNNRPHYPAVGGGRWARGLGSGIDRPGRREFSARIR